MYATSVCAAVYSPRTIYRPCLFSVSLRGRTRIYIYTYTTRSLACTCSASRAFICTFSEYIYTHTVQQQSQVDLYSFDARARVLGYICRLLARTRAPGDDLALSGRELQPAIPPVAAVLSAVCISICRCACKGASDLFPPRGDSLGVCTCTPIAGFSPRVYFRNAVFGNRSLRFTLSHRCIYTCQSLS